MYIINNNHEFCLVTSVAGQLNAIQIADSFLISLLIYLLLKS